MPRQQEVDPQVFAEAGDNDKRIDIDLFISHRWEADQSNHPNPTGRQWKAVLSLIDAIYLVTLASKQENDEKRQQVLPTPLATAYLSCVFHHWNTELLNVWYT